MKGSRAASRYAKAVLDLAKDKNAAKAVNDDMLRIQKTIAGSEDLQGFLKSPVVSATLKKNSLVEIFSGINEITSSLFNILLENNRIQLLQLVALRYNQFYNEMNGVQVAKVTSVVPLTTSLEEKIQDKVKELTGNTAKIENIIDENILGGFILRVGDLQYNASIAHQLKTLKREFTNKTYVSKLN